MVAMPSQMDVGIEIEVIGVGEAQLVVAGEVGGKNDACCSRFHGCLPYDSVLVKQGEGEGWVRVVAEIEGVVIQVNDEFLGGTSRRLDGCRRIIVGINIHHL